MTGRQFVIEAAKVAEV